jgi:hypothetical protein
MAQSDDISRPAGSGVPFEFNGEELVFPPLTIELIGEVKQHLLRQRPEPTKVLREHIEALGDLATPELIEKMVSDSMAAGRKLNVVTDRELAEFIDTIDGVILTFWLAFERKYPKKFTKDQVASVIQSMDAEGRKELMDVRDQATGWDDRGNSTGRTP